MFNLGDVVVVSVNEEGTGITNHHNCWVLEYDDGLLKVEQFGKITIYNMRSIHFHKAEKQ